MRQFFKSNYQSLEYSSSTPTAHRSCLHDLFKFVECDCAIGALYLSGKFILPLPILHPQCPPNIMNNLSYHPLTPDCLQYAYSLQNSSAYECTALSWSCPCPIWQS